MMPQFLRPTLNQVAMNLRSLAAPDQVVNGAISLQQFLRRNVRRLIQWIDHCFIGNTEHLAEHSPPARREDSHCTLRNTSSARNSIKCWHASARAIQIRRQSLYCCDTDS